MVYYRRARKREGGLAPIFVLQHFTLQGSLLGMFGSNFGAENSKYMGIQDEILAPGDITFGSLSTG